MSREFQLVAPEQILSEIARVFKWGSTGKAASVTQISLIIAVLKLIFGMLLSPLSSCCLAYGGLQLSFFRNYRQLQATPRRWQEQNPSPLQEQQAFSGAESSLHCPNLFLRIWRRLFVSSFPHGLLSYVASFLLVSAWIWEVWPPLLFPSGVVNNASFLVCATSLLEACLFWCF